MFFDSAQYDLIQIGYDVTISFDVTILVHDYSIKHAARTYNKDKFINQSIRKSVIIGNNVFIGAKSIILPGTVIADNCIIGAGTVIKGNTEAGGIYCGNPAHKISNAEKMVKKYMEVI